MLARYEYDVFGAIRSETGMSDNTRKFTGKEFDADSNLYYYGARYYDPYIGQIRAVLRPIRPFKPLVKGIKMNRLKTDLTVTSYPSSVPLSMIQYWAVAKLPT